VSTTVPYLINVKERDLIACFLGSVPCFDSSFVLFSPHRGHDTTWGGPSHQVYAQLSLDIPYTGFRLHLRTECEDSFFTIVSD
jgi:hypothetical protein